MLVKNRLMNNFSFAYWSINWLNSWSLKRHPNGKQDTPDSGLDSAPGFFRRLAAIGYDSILLLAVLFAATAIILPFNSGEALSDWQIILYRIYLLVVSFLFYGWFWTHGGQTLGLRAWKIKILTLNHHKPISWKQALVRFSFALVSWAVFGLGFLWILVNKNKLAWHDSLSQSGLFFDQKDHKTFTNASDWLHKQPRTTLPHWEKQRPAPDSNHKPIPYC